MPKENCPYCHPAETFPKKAEFLKPFNEVAQCTSPLVEKKSATMLSLDELYHVAQTLESQAQRLRTFFGLVIASQPPSPNDNQVAGCGVPPDCELIGRLEEISRCLRRTLATHEETIELRRI